MRPQTDAEDYSLLSKSSRNPDCRVSEPGVHAELAIIEDDVHIRATQYAVVEAVLISFGNRPDMCAVWRAGRILGTVMAQRRS